MQALLIFILLLVLALILGAGIAYPAHLLLSNWFELDFERVASRAVLLVAIILLLTQYKKFGFSTWSEVGFSHSRKEFFKQLRNGFLLGLIVMLPVVAGLLICGNRVIDPDWDFSFSNITSLVLIALIAGVIIGLIEETIFRGVMLTSIQKQSSALFAIITSSSIYALIHFLEPSIIIETPSWLSGFEILHSALQPLLQPELIFDSFLALLLAGIFLAVIKVRTQQLVLCIGIHAGWVFTIKVFKRMTDANAASEFAFLTGNYDKVIGYFAALCIALAIIIFLNASKRNNTSTLDSQRQ